MTLVSRPMWKYAGGLGPVVAVWVILVVWLVSLIYARVGWSDEADRATVREWLEESRTFRKTLPDVVREYVRLRADAPSDDRTRQKRDEVAEQMRALAEPTRIYLGQLPSFPVVYRLEVILGDGPDDTILWDSPLPRPRRHAEERVQTVEAYPLGDDKRVVIRCEYQLHAFNKLQRQEAERRRVSLVAGAVLLTATLLAAVFVYRFLHRERVRDMERLTAMAEAEHHERELLEARLKQQQAEREQADREAELRQVADRAQREALEMKSQLYAGIGVMAGSYAHNIKNLLVRPNDLLARCLEADGMNRDQHGMLEEVRHTLGTVTERLQQILRTVRRDPSKTAFARLDIAAFVRATAATWTDTARDKWKLKITADAAEPVWVEADLSHLQQAVENLVFNARDATFEMRNHLREAARQATTDRKQRLLDAAGWKGEVTLSAAMIDGRPVLEVRDNGIGMTAAVKEQCLQTHFTTKRDNAIYEGYTAGMGLGLSFVAVVLDHHRATLTIESEPLKGTVFRVTFQPPAGSPAGSSQ